MSWSKIGYMIAGGALALVIVFGAVATFAQSGAAPSLVRSVVTDGAAIGPLAHRGGDTIGRERIGGFDGHEALAEALGISVEELEAALASAREATVAQAVVDGLLTQEQADAILARERGFGRGIMRFAGQDGDTFLAEALGISVEELEAAKAEVMQARLDQMVADGVITQEAADMMQARQEVRSRLDLDGVNAAIAAAYEAAVEEALADGAITQAQADELLSNTPTLDSLGGHGRRGFDGRGFGPGRGHGFAPGPGTLLTPDVDA